MSPSPRFAVPVLAGAAVLALVASPTASAAPSPSPGGLGTVAPRTSTAQQKQYRGWVLTLASGSTSAQAVRHQKATTDAMTSLDAADAGRIRGAAGKHGAKVTKAQANANDRVTVRLDKAIDQAAASAMVGGQVLKAEPDLTMTASDAGSMTSAPDDTLFNLQWAITGTYGTKANQVWPTDTGKGVTVAVIDTGITDHPDLQGKTIGGYDFVSDSTLSNDGNGRDSDPHDAGDWTTANECYSGSTAEDSSWHGTHVSSLIGATGNNSAGISGVAPAATIEPIRALASCGGSSTDIADAITWASGGAVAGVPTNSNPAKVINLSLGGSYPSCPSYYQTAIDGARSRGSIVVVAAGNSSVDASQSVPANCSGVITVAATGQDGTKASYSNYGSTVTVAAPGGGAKTSTDYIAGAGNDGTTTPGSAAYVYMAGTSQATPQVSGTLALMAADDPSITPDQAKSVLTSTATATGDTSIGAGIVNAPAAVAAAQKLAGTASPPTYAATGLFGEHTGDSYADVYGVDGTGALTLFQGSPTSMTKLQSYGTSMTGITYLVQIGDWTGDQRSDVLARTSDSSLWIYSSSATGSLTAWKKVGQNWGGMDQIVYAGLLDGTTRYVVARQASTGDLYRYVITSSGLTSGTRIGQGWGAMKSFFSVGDFNNDGRDDVIGVRSDGTMWLYASTSDARLGNGVQIGHGWGTFSHAFSAGDFNGDGRRDLLGADASGNLWGYTNTGKGSWSAAIKLGTGFGAYTLLA